MIIPSDHLDGVFMNPVEVPHSLDLGLMPWEGVLDDSEAARNVKFATDGSRANRPEKLPVPPDEAKCWTTRALLERPDSPQEWRIEDLLPREGFVLIAGKRKIGKGWLTQQMASACGTGTDFWGRTTQPSKVLIYALEDNPTRIARRIRQQSVPASADISWCFKWPGWAAVAARIEEGGFGVCIIDTLSRATPGVKQNDVGAMTKILSEWQEFGLDHGVLIIATDHERKSMGDGQHGMDEVLGSQAKTAVSDAVIQLHRSRGSHDTKLSADGRDYEEIVELNVFFDRSQCRWRVQEEDVGTSARVEGAISSFQAEGTLPTTRIIAHKLQMSKSHVSETLANLVADGKVIKGKKIGRERPYFIAGTSLGEWYETSNDVADGSMIRTIRSDDPKSESEPHECP